MSQHETIDNQSAKSDGGDADAAKRELPAAAKRALAEAKERRRKHDADAKTAPKELGGGSGPDPARYGDWEKNGIASDF